MYLLVSALVLMISFFLFKRAAGSLSPFRLNMVSWIFYFEMLTQYFVSAVFVIHSIDEHYLISKISNPNARLYGYLTVMYTMVFFPLGMVLANFVWKANTKALFNQYTDKIIVTFVSKKDSFIRFPLYLFSALSILAVLYTFYYMREIPLLQMLSRADALDLAVAREEAGRGFQGNFFIRNVLGITLTPILSYIAFGYYRMTKSGWDRTWFYVMFVFSVLIVTYNISKAPLILYILGYLFFIVLEKGRISKWVFITAAAGVVGLLVLMYSFLSETDLDLLFGLRFGIPGRILFSQSAAIYLTFDTFPLYRDFIGISSFSDYVSWLGIAPSERSSRLLMETYFSSRVEEGTAGVLNTLFVAEAYANFGLAGVLIAPAYVGFLVQSMYIFFLKQKKTPLLLGMFTYFSYKGGISGGFNEYIYNSGLLILLVMILVILAQTQFFRSFFSESSPKLYHQKNKSSN